VRCAIRIARFEEPPVRYPLRLQVAVLLVENTGCRSTLFEKRKRAMRRAEFQFSIRSLLLTTLMVAGILFAVMHAIRNESTAQAIDSPLILMFGALGVLLFSAVADVAGRTLGAVIGAVVAAVIWLVLLSLLLYDTPALPARRHFAIHSLAAGVAVAAVIGSLLIPRLRKPRNNDTGDTIRHLLAFKRKEIDD